jgi:hypothetical protein
MLPRLLPVLFPILLVSVQLAAEEIPPEVKLILSRHDAALATEERNYHIAQAKVKEDTVKELEKLLKIERRRKGSTLVPDLEARVAAFEKEIALLKDETLFQVTKLDELLKKKALTEEAWNAAPGSVFTLDAKEPRNPTKIRVEQGAVYYVLPHPTDTWQAGPGKPKVGYLGEKNGTMKLVIRCGEKINTDFFVSETGMLTLGAEETVFGDNIGTLRVKIVRLR